MYYIVETVEQLKRLIPEESCYVEVIPGNNKHHPLLTSTSLIYYRNSQKGYIMTVKHSEAFELPVERVLEFLQKHKTVYCLDAKYSSYFIEGVNLVDITQITVNEENRVFELDCDTTVHSNYWREYPYLPTVNSLIPISKHYERCEKIYEVIERYIGKETSVEFYADLQQQYGLIERQGLGIDTVLFDKFFETAWRPYSISEGKIFTSYNLYNLTARPTNAYNNINFLALNKEDSSRKAFKPQNDLFIEFDFEGYHLKLIANLLEFVFDSTISIHTQLGREYFKKEELSEEEYAESKAITFRQIYGGVQAEYRNVPFFKKIVNFIEELWESFQSTGVILLPTGRALYKDKTNLTPQKLFNYYVQNLETYVNVQILKKLNNILSKTKSKIVLVVYDSFLLDFAIEDGKEVLLSIKRAIEEEGFTVKAKIGQNYHSLTKTDYL